MAIWRISGVKNRRLLFLFFPFQLPYAVVFHHTHSVITRKIDEQVIRTNAKPVTNILKILSCVLSCFFQKNVVSALKFIEYKKGAHNIWKHAKECENKETVPGCSSLNLVTSYTFPSMAY